MKDRKTKRPPRNRYRYALRIAGVVSEFLYLTPRGWCEKRAEAYQFTWRAAFKALARLSPAQIVEIVRVNRH